MFSVRLINSDCSSAMATAHSHSHTHGHTSAPNAYMYNWYSTIHKMWTECAQITNAAVLMALSLSASRIVCLPYECVCVCASGALHTWWSGDHSNISNKQYTQCVRSLYHYCNLFCCILSYNSLCTLFFPSVCSSMLHLCSLHISVLWAVTMSNKIH